MSGSACDVVVVGGGIAALTAAAAARRSGSSVHLVEAHRLGGRARSDHRRGFVFNRGPHGLYDRGPGWAVLKTLGVKVAGARAPIAGAWALRGDRLFLLPTSPSSLIRTALLSPMERVSLGRVFSSLPRTTTPDLVALSAREWCHNVAARPAVSEVLQALLRLSTYASDLDALSADAAVTQLRLSTGGVTYLAGGWQTIVDGLEEAVRASGVHISLGQAVTHLERTATGVVVGVGDDEIVGRSVVLAVGSPEVTSRLLPGAVTGDLGDPVQATCVDYGLSVPPARRFILGIDEALYLSLHAPTAALAPPGHAVLCAMAYGPPTDRTVERLDQLVAMAGVEPSTILERRVLASMTVAHGLPRPHLGLAGRPGITVAGTDNCFLAGDWVGGVGLLADAAVASGLAAGTAASQR